MGYYTEKSPSLCEYFSWINNTNEGSTEGQTLANLAFFKWLQEETGAKFDIYAFDAGNIDGAAGTYGSTRSERFRSRYPRGFTPVAQAAKELGMRLGVWGGADGFGDTEESAKERFDMIVELCRDFGFGLFKFDTVCGVLRKEYRETFTKMIEECRKSVPELVILNHRNDLGGAQRYCTTKLWESAETYIDVLYANRECAPHHRGGTLSRGNPEGLERLVEDHGVCLSSCLDFWADELVIQAFCRGLILSPQIYGNPWLLRDDELRTLGWLIALKREYREILVDGIELPESTFGPHAVSRGNESLRFATLRNLSFEPREYVFKPNEELGLKGTGAFVRSAHPYLEDYGYVAPGENLRVTLEPYRTRLLIASANEMPHVAAKGAKLRVMRDIEGKPFRAKIYGLPGEEITFRLTGDTAKYSKATVNGADAKRLIEGGEYTLRFPGEKPIRGGVKLGELSPAQTPDDAEALYEAAVFAADNNALEARSLYRSGPSDIAEVTACRKAYFEQDTFVYRGIWDKYAFDGREDTFFMASTLEADQRISGGMLRIDAGKPVSGDALRVTFLLEKGETVENVTAEGGETLSGFQRLDRASTSAPKSERAKLVPKTVPEIVEIDVSRVTVEFALTGPKRYFRLRETPVRVCDIRVIKGGETLPRENWRASNLFAPYEKAPAQAALSGEIEIGGYPEGAKICVALEGRHGVDGAYVVMTLPDGTVLGAPDKSPSFPVNQFEHFSRSTGFNNTFYFPVTPEMQGKRVKITALTLRNGCPFYKASVWVAESDTLPVTAELELS